MGFCGGDNDDDRIPLWCPWCGKRHVDEGNFTTIRHHTHRCVDDSAGAGCGREWRLGPYVFGVADVTVEPSPPLPHDWGEPDVDWVATRICKRCNMVHVYDHGPNHGPDLYRLGDYMSSEDPGCKTATTGAPR